MILRAARCTLHQMLNIRAVPRKAAFHGEAEGNDGWLWRDAEGMAPNRLQKMHPAPSCANPRASARDAKSWQYGRGLLQTPLDPTYLGRSTSV